MSNLFKKLPGISIFFPFMNDEGTVEQAIALAYYFGHRVAHKVEVIAIHGGNSRDHTWNAIQTAKKYFPRLRILNQKKNKIGYAVIKHGFAAAKQPWVFYTDGDLQYEIADLLRLVETQQVSQADVVNGFKTNRGDSFFRIWLGNAYAFLSQFLFSLPIRDVDCDFRLIRRSMLKGFRLTKSGGSILPELIIKLQRNSAQFAEVPVRHTNRRYGKSNYSALQLLKEKIQGDLALYKELKQL